MSDLFFDKLVFELEGIAVSALIHCGISLVRTDLDGVERTIVFVLAMMLAFLYRTLDACVCALRITFHNNHSPKIRCLFTLCV